MEETFSMERNMEENFSMEWKMEWKIFGMEWNKIASMEYGKIVFHSIPYHALVLLNYSPSSIIRSSWATFSQNLGRIRKVSIIRYPPSTTYITLKEHEERKKYENKLNH